MIFLWAKRESECIYEHLRGQQHRTGDPAAREARRHGPRRHHLQQQRRRSVRARRHPGVCKAAWNQSRPVRPPESRHPGLRAGGRGRRGAFPELKGSGDFQGACTGDHGERFAGDPDADH